MPADIDSWPVDWHLWRAQWSDWVCDHAALLSQRCPHHWPRPSIAADAVLMYVHVGDRCIELSELTIQLDGPRTRHVGISYLDPATGTTSSADAVLADSPAELAKLLFHG